MIFITLGSQKFQFNRLLIAVDRLVESGEIKEEVFAQTGYSDYIPKYFKFKNFLNHDDFKRMQEKADIVITHGGTGAIIGAVKNGKKVIAVPRLAKYGEHVDDHQIQLIEQFKDQNIICGLEDCEQLSEGMRYAREHTFDKYKSNTKTIVNSIDRFIDSIL